MSIAMEGRVRVLEAEVKRLNEVLTGLLDVMSAQAEAKTPGNGPRQMCPKCNEKPAYHLHVINCKGPKRNGAAL